MANEKSPIKVTAKRQIFKYAEGADPEKDAPYEIIDVDQVYEGEEAIELLKRMGMNTDGIN